MTVEESRTMQAVQNIAIKIDNFTLRDYFAGQALAGIMTNIKQDFGENPQEYIAKICYNYADALIKEKKGGII